MLFRLGVPVTASFPYHIWRRLLARSLRTLAKIPAAYVDAEGRPLLREAIANHVSFARAVACNADDVMVDRIPTDARVSCVTPSHQFPVGVAMSMRRRTELLEFARVNDAVIIEDDYDGEIRYGKTTRDALLLLVW